MSQTQLCVENWMDILPPDYQIYRITSYCFDPILLKAYSAIKERFPEMYVNFKDGKRVYNWCGYRTLDCNIGAANSAHKTGKALDLHFGNSKADTRKLFDWVMANCLAIGIKRVEDPSVTIDGAKGNGWLHIDTMPPNEARWKDRTKPYVFTP